jgi:hypothetical protein
MFIKILSEQSSGKKIAAPAAAVVQAVDQNISNFYQ